MELKPCPFCGSENVNIDADIDDYWYWVYCQECETRGPISTVGLDAIEAWNRRAD